VSGQPVALTGEHGALLGAVLAIDADMQIGITYGPGDITAREAQILHLIHAARARRQERDQRAASLRAMAQQRT